MKTISDYDVAFPADDDAEALFELIRNLEAFLPTLHLSQKGNGGISWKLFYRTNYYIGRAFDALGETRGDEAVMAGPQLFAVEVLTEDEREFFLRSPQHFWHAIDLEATGLTEEWQQKERENAAWLS